MVSNDWYIAKAHAEGKFPPPPLVAPTLRWWERLYPSVYGR